MEQRTDLRMESSDANDLTDGTLILYGYRPVICRDILCPKSL